MWEKLPKKLGLSHISARLSHPAQDWRIVGEFKKTFRALKARLGGLSETPPIEIRFEDVPRRTRDEGRGRPEERARPTVGQARNKTKAGRRSALRQRLSIRRDMAARGVGAALAPPYADTDMMQLHLDETSSNLARGTRPVASRQGWLAHRQQTRHARKHHTDLPSLRGPRSETRSRTFGSISVRIGSQLPPLSTLPATHGGN
jgi:hypothetical protein